MRENDADNNGNHISDYFSAIVRSDYSGDMGSNSSVDDNWKVLEELKKADFISADEGGNRVQFYKPEEVWNTISKQNGLTIISPFLSDGFVKRLSDEGRIKHLISTEQGYAKLKEKTVNEILEKHGQDYRIYGPGNLHAKIYSWEEDDKTKYIVGSSNATNNGCNILGQSKKKGRCS